MIPKILKLKDSQLELFSSGYWSSYGGKSVKAEFPIPLEDLKRYDYVFGMFDKKNNLVGGYIINKKAERILVGLPEEIQDKIKEDFSEGKRIEVSALWKTRSNKKIIYLWAHLLITSFLINPKAIYFSVYTHHKLFDIYATTGADLFYNGGHGNLSIFRGHLKGYSKAILVRELNRIKSIISKKRKHVNINKEGTNE